jgi:hypothetical protein
MRLMKLMLNQEGRPRLLMMDAGTRPPAAAAAAETARQLVRLWINKRAGPGC